MNERAAEALFKRAERLEDGILSLLNHLLYHESLVPDRAVTAATERLKKRLERDHRHVFTFRLALLTYTRLCRYDHLQDDPDFQRAASEFEQMEKTYGRLLANQAIPRLDVAVRYAQ